MIENTEHEVTKKIITVQFTQEKKRKKKKGKIL